MSDDFERKESENKRPAERTPKVDAIGESNVLYEVFSAPWA